MGGWTYIATLTLADQGSQEARRAVVLIKELDDRTLPRLIRSFGDTWPGRIPRRRKGPVRLVSGLGHPDVVQLASGFGVYALADSTPGVCHGNSVVS